jgi:uncharacterized membrane protein required for colicin V production
VSTLDYFLIGAIVWLAFFALWGLFTGFWRALAGTASLVLAYWASVHFAPNLAAQFPALNLNPTLAWVLWATVIFFAVGFLVRQLTLMLAKRMPIGNAFINRVGGGVISVGYGAALGIATVWGVALLAESWNARVAQSGAQNAARFDTSSPVVIWSRRFMGQWVSWNLRGSGSAEFAELSAAMAENPSEILADVRAAVQSPEFQQISSSAAVREMVRRQDAESLLQSAEFQQFMQQPAVRQLREKIAPQDSDRDQAEIAQKFISVWGRMEHLKTRPEVAAILNDPEWQAFLQGEGKLTPSLLARGQKLLTMLGGDSGTPAVERAPKLFQWHDQDGQLQVTDYDAIPVDKKASAQALKFSP